jgi:hypothetical protein
MARKASREPAVRIVVPKHEMATAGLIRATIAGQSSLGATCSCKLGVDGAEGRRDTKWTSNPLCAIRPANCFPTKPEPPAMTIFRFTLRSRSVRGAYR